MVKGHGIYVTCVSYERNFEKARMEEAGTVLMKRKFREQTVRSGKRERLLKRSKGNR
jgi:hypothetical protein